MIRSTSTSHGTIIIREANLADVDAYRKLRLNALQNSPATFSVDYQMNFWNNQGKYYDEYLMSREIS